MPSKVIKPTKASRAKKASSSSSNLPSTLALLPRKVLDRIVTFIPDLDDVFALSRTCRALKGTLTDKHLWSHLFISVPEDEGTEQQRASALKTRVQTIIDRGSENQWREVTRITTMPLPGAIPEVVRVLGLASETLGRLTLEGPERVQGSPPPLAIDTLDSELLSSNLHFPNLAHICLSEGFIRYPGFVNLLCSISPKLTSLDVDLSHYRSPSPNASPDPTCPPLEHDTQIGKLRICFGSRQRGEDLEVLETIKDVLRRSPKLREMTLLYLGYQRSAVSDVLAVIRRSNRVLTDLFLDISSITLGALAEMRTPGYTNLTRLLLKTELLTDIYQLPAFEAPKLEKIYLDSSYWRLPRHKTFGVQRPGHDGRAIFSSILPSLAEQIQLPKPTPYRNARNGIGIRGRG